MTTLLLWVLLDETLHFVQGDNVHSWVLYKEGLTTHLILRSAQDDSSDLWLYGAILFRGEESRLSNSRSQGGENRSAGSRPEARYRLQAQL